MDLHNFIEQALFEIRKAAEGADKKIQAECAKCPPRNLGDLNIVETMVKFDVAVEATSEDGTNGSGGIKVLGGIISVNGKATTEVKERSTTVSRISVEIPIFIPPIGLERFDPQQ